MSLFYFRLSALLLVLSQGSFSKTVYSDLFVFRTSGAAYSLNKLEEYSSYLTDLKCYYPESLTAVYYRHLASPPKEYFKIESFKQKNEQEKFKKVTDSFVAMMKMIRYASSQSVSVSSDLPKAFRLSAKKNNCSLAGFTGDELKEESRNLALLEVFLRSRFVPGDTEKLSQKQRYNILKNIASLEESVKNQIEHELFEN